MKKLPVLCTYKQIFHRSNIGSYERRNHLSRGIVAPTSRRVEKTLLKIRGKSPPPPPPPREICNAVNFLPNPHNIHLIDHPLGRNMGYNLWFDTLSYILFPSTQCCVKYRVILDHVITALDCTFPNASEVILIDMSQIHMCHTAPKLNKGLTVCICLGMYNS